MNRMLQLFLLLATLIAAGTSGASAQAPTPQVGDYGSVANDNWMTATTWKLYSTNNAFDSTTTTPPSSSKNVFILPGTTVTYNQSSQNCKNLVVQAGGVLQGNAVLPTSSIVYLKVNGPTVWVDGTFGKDSTDNLSLEMKFDGVIKLSGSGVVNMARLRPNSSATGNPAFEFAMNAKINYTGSSGTGGAGLYTTNYSSTKPTSVTVTVDSGVTVDFAPLSNLATSSGSTPGGVVSTFNINGTVNIPAGNMNLNDSAAVALHVGPSGKLTLGGKLMPFSAGSDIAAIDVATGGVFNIISGGMADFTNPSAKVTGGGTFAILPGGGISVGAAAGLDAASGPVQTAIATFDTGGIYAYVGTGLQQWGAQLPDSVRGLTIGASSTDTVFASDIKTVTGTLTINGLLVDNGGLRSAGSATVNGTYQYNISNPADTVAAIPTATWNTNSTCLVTNCRVGISTGIPGGNQNFYHFTFDAPTLSGVPRIGFVSDTLRGNLTIHNTNTNPADGTGNFVVLGPSTVNTFVTLLGDLVIDSLGSVSPGYGSGVCAQTLDVKGNVLTKGWMFMNGSGVSNKYLLRGNLIVSNPIAGAIRGHSSTANPDSIIICGTGVQKILKPMALTSMNHVRWRVAPGSTLWLNDTTAMPYSGNGSFKVDSGATLIMSNARGANGNFLAAPTLSVDGSYVFNGDSAQVTGMWFAAKVKNLTIADSLGVTLSDSVTVTDTLRLTTGNLSTTDSSLVSIASTGRVVRTNNYVIGRLRKEYAAPGDKNFEIGTAAGYSPVDVNVTVGSGLMTASAVHGYHPDTFDTTKTLSEFWTLAADTSIKTADLKFSYLPADVHGNEIKYGVYRYTGTGKTWTPLTTVNWNGQDYVVTTGVTSFGDFTLGESNDVTKVDQEASTIPDRFYIDQNYPNPFNPSTTISYGLPNDAFVTLKIYNLVGQEVATVVAQDQRAGVHTVSFSGSRLSSGVYFYRIQAGSFTEVKRMLLLK